MLIPDALLPKRERKTRKEARKELEDIKKRLGIK